MRTIAVPVERSALQDLLPLAADPAVTSFALGLPDPDLFPLAGYARAMETVLAQGGRAIQYGPPPSSLREHICRIMRRQGVVCTPSQLVMTSGAQQGINLLGRLLLTRGAPIVTEPFVYPGFQQVVQPFQPRYLTVPSDPVTGIDPDAVEAVLRAEPSAAFIYLNPQGHNPLGSTMPVDARERLMAVARRADVPVIEDQVYGLLTYAGAELPALRAWGDHAFYVGSFSKILSPGLRVGWIVAPERFVAPLASLKEATDIDTSTLTQRLVSAFLDVCDFDAHLAGLRRAYVERRETLLRALERHLSGLGRWHTPSHGFFVWVELLEHVEATAALRRAIADDRVAFLPSQPFCVPGGPQRDNGMRLAFSNCPLIAMDDGIRRLSRALEAATAADARMSRAARS